YVTAARRSGAERPPGPYASSVKPALRDLTARPDASLGAAAKQEWSWIDRHSVHVVPHELRVLALVRGIPADGFPLRRRRHCIGPGLEGRLHLLQSLGLDGGEVAALAEVGFQVEEKILALRFHQLPTPFT
ncbi:MAG: hypothetical protein ACK56I_32130, partial [bacterium]